MPISEHELQNIAALASLELDTTSAQQLTADVTAIMAVVEQLRNIDTTGVIQLFHPLNLHHRLREDEVHTTAHCVAQLEKIAPLFTDQLYWVPKVIDSGK